MKAETIAATSLQQMQANALNATTPLPAADLPACLRTPVIPAGCEKVYAAIHSDQMHGPMTWTK